MTQNPDWWRGAVVYQIYPRSFFDSSGDGIGDLPGIIQKLDYIESLGVDAVWISPFFRSPMVDFGYDVSDYKDIDSIFGRMSDFDALLEGLHERGIKMIIDLVLSHTSNEHPWFIESRQDRTNPKADWYVWAKPKDDGMPPNNWLSLFGGMAWEYDMRRGEYYYYQFFEQQPKLNLHNPEVQEELLGVVKWWLDKGVDGLRLDVVNHYFHDEQFRDNPIRKEADRTKAGDRNSHHYFWQKHVYDKTRPENIPFLQRLRKLTDQYPSGIVTIAEMSEDEEREMETCVEYTKGDDRLHTAYSLVLLKAHEVNANDIRAGVEHYFEIAPDGFPAWSLENHDFERVASRWAIDGDVNLEQVKTFIAMVCSLRGTPLLYAGQELGLEEADLEHKDLQDPYGLFLWPEDKGRDGCRTPIPWDSKERLAGFTISDDSWLPIPHVHVEKSVADQESKKDSVLNFSRHFLHWRKQQEALIKGDMEFIHSTTGMLVLVRKYQEQEVVVALNLRNEEEVFEFPFEVSELDGHGLPFILEGKTLTLPPFGGFFGARSK